jgi:hypothetical protein
LLIWRGQSRLREARSKMMFAPVGVCIRATSLGAYVRGV